jgi:multidrug efflux system membrane fusion protein
VDTLKGTIIIPSAAVQRGPQGTFVYLVKGDSTVELRDIVIGPTEGEETAVRSGLAAGETVVVEGVDKLQKGTKVAAARGGTTRPTTRSTTQRGEASTPPRQTQSAPATEGAR